MEDKSTSAGDLANVVYIFASNHEEGLVAAVLLVATIVTLTGRTLLKPTVFLLGFLPFFSFFASAAFYYFCASTTTATCLNFHSPLQICAALVSFVLGIVAGVLVLQRLFPLATFFLIGVAGVILVLVAHILLLQPRPNLGDVFFYAVAVAAALIMGIMSLYNLGLMIVIGSAIDGAAIAMYALLHFFGVEPSVLGQVPGAEGSLLWTLVYGVGVIFLSCYGTFVQLRMAAADQQPERIIVGPGPDSREDEPLIASYGAADDEYSKHALGAGPLLAYDEETGGQS